MIYANRANKTAYRDVKSGVCGPWNGNITGVGYDLCTGVGVPFGYSGK